MEYEVIQIMPAADGMVAWFEGKDDYEWKRVVALALVRWSSGEDGGDIISPCVISGSGASIEPCCLSKRYIKVSFQNRNERI